MRIVSGMIVLAFLCTTVTGCSLFKKNNADGTANAQKGGAPPPKFPQDPLLNAPGKTAANPAPVPIAKGTSTLAGTVYSADHRPIGNAYIQPVNLEEEKQGGAPIEVVTDNNGHFFISGLKAGDRYKLIARTKVGDKLLAGYDLTRTPNVFVEIVISENGVNAGIPPLPAAPGQAPTKAAGSAGTGGTAWNAATDGRPAERNLPATMNVPAPPATKPVGNTGTPPGAPVYVPGMADNPDKNTLPLINIPGQGNRPTTPPNLPADPPRPAGLGDARLDTGPALVPSCVMVGKRLESLALRDCRGQVWEYRKQGHGKLVLIDFWGTYCMHCREAMPLLDRLQNLYGSRGLEVIGIALEAGKDERKEADAVNRYATAMKLHYRQLMGHAGNFDAGQHFMVKNVPTLILLNEDGDWIWHHVGRPDTSDFNLLERTIQTHLNNRPF